VTCEILHKAGKWYVSVALEVETIQRECGMDTGAFDWGLAEFLTVATPQGMETVANPRHLRNQIAELKRLGQEVSRKVRMAQQQSRRKKRFPVSANLRKAIWHLARLHAKIARQRTEALAVKNMVHGGGVHKKGLNREIHAASPAAFLKMVRTKAQQAGSWYEEAPTREIKPTQRCHACWRLPDEKKMLSDRNHQCPHCGAARGRDENAALVLLRWLEAKLSGREPSEVWRAERSGTRMSCLSGG
jgi:putative transposase